MDNVWMTDSSTSANSSTSNFKVALGKDELSLYLDSFLKCPISLTLRCPAKLSLKLKKFLKSQVLL